MKRSSLINKISKIEIIFLLSFIPIRLFSQVGYFDNNPVWEMYSSCAIPYPCIEYRNYNYYINGDTTFNSHIYKKMFIRGNGSFLWQGNPPIPTGCQTPYIFNDTINPYAYVRDTLNKIYFTGFGNPDTLLYDFNLSVGDTLPITFNNSSQNITIDSIDSIAISNYYRKRFHLSQNFGIQYLIEGLGHDWGFFEPFPPIFDCGYNLLCFGVNDTAYYPAFNSNSCNINVGINELHSSSQLIVAPNPFTNTLTVTNNHSQPAAITIYDMTSRVLLQQHFTNTVTLNTAQLAKGIYIYSVNNKSGVIKNGKVIKE